MKKIGGTKVARRDTLLQSALKNGSGPRNGLYLVCLHFVLNLQCFDSLCTDVGSELMNHTLTL